MIPNLKIEINYIDHNMKQIKQLLFFIGAIITLILLLFIIDNKKQETEYSDVFFGQISEQMIHRKFS